MKTATKQTRAAKFDTRDYLELAGMIIGTMAAFGATFPLSIGLLTGNGNLVAAGLVVAALGFIPVMIANRD